MNFIKDFNFIKIFIQQLVIEEGTAAHKAWAETPIPVYTKFYFFSLLSDPELYLRHEKPLVEERGPYTFRFVCKVIIIELKYLYLKRS